MLFSCLYRRVRTPFWFVFLCACCTWSNANYAQCGPCEFPSGNLVVNGDFEQGDVGFTTDYNYATVVGPWGLLSNEGVYVIGSNANNYHTFFQGFDHTNPPNGQFMIVNGAATPNTNVWCQTIEIIPNTWYSFAAWAQNIDTGPNQNFADLQFTIDGQPLGDNVIVDGGWTPFVSEWFSGTSTVIDICLVNNQTGGGGNDFGIDDISFSTCIPYNVVGTPSAGNDVTVCSGEIVNLGEPALANFSYNWQGPGLNGNTQANPSFTAQNNATEPITQVFILQTDSAATGCLQTNEVTVTTLPLPQPDAGANQSICIGETVELTVGQGWQSVLWSTGETTETITVDEPGNYEVSVVLLGCENSTSVTVTSPPLPEFTLGPDTSICEDQSFVFTAGGINGLWSTGASTTEIEASSEGWYWFEVENQGCTSRDSVFLEVLSYPIVNLEPLVEICPGETHTYFTNDTGVWSTGITADSLVVTAPGTYSVVVANGQCLTEGMGEVELLELPFVDLGGDRRLCQPNAVRVDVSGPFNDAVIWSDGSEDFDRLFTTSGIYAVVAVNGCGTWEDSFVVEIEDCDYGFFIPNAFTPDGDGLNEVWQPVIVNMESFRIVVMNRWGEEVWSTEEEGTFWNGSHQSGTYFVPDGVYAYIAQGRSNQGQIVSTSGSIIVIR